MAEEQDVEAARVAFSAALMQASPRLAGGLHVADVRHATRAAVAALDAYRAMIAAAAERGGVTNDRADPR